jgi:hypothetical protein
LFIPNPDFFHPGSQIQDFGSQILDKSQTPDFRSRTTDPRSNNKKEEQGKKIGVLPFFVAIYIFEQVKKIYKPTNNELEYFLLKILLLCSQ